ncbi:hypothetical protein BKA82DRAFT_4066754 [Pisolithus tinctorius]|nr:hypothetical protein BKA82DRAFT_4066754 [Pisolithus tinctorius]
MATSFAPSLASLSTGTRPPSRTDRSGNSGSSKNYVLPVPSGFSVRIFKAPSLSASSRQHANQQPSVPKGDADYRSSSQSRQSAPAAWEGHHKLTRAPPAQSPDDSQGRNGRFGGIHTGPVSDSYIYERPLLSNSNSYYYQTSSDTTGSDIDSIFSATHSSSSSNSSLEDSPRRGALQLAPPERRPPYGQRNPAPLVTYPGTYHTCPTCTELCTGASSMPTSRVDAHSQGSRPLPTPPVSTRVRKDSLQLTTERSPSISPNHLRPRPPPLHIEDIPSYPVYVQGTYRGQWQPDDIPAAPQLGRSGSQRSVTSSNSGSYGPLLLPPGLFVQDWEHPLTSAPSDIGGEISARPQRRKSEGGKPHVHEPRRIRSQTAPAPRSVRWCENLICPSPVLPSQRRKGWFNRRGDQLWRNDGSYRPPPPGEAYPPDLDDYPEPNEGWQNEEGVRIDLSRRLIPKVPLRGVLKQTNYCPEEGIVAGYLMDSPVSATSEDEE